MTVLVVTTDGKITEEPFPDDFLRFSYQAIGCMMVERVRLTEIVDMWVDEEGMYTQKSNPFAVFICRKFGYPAQNIFGNCVITGTEWTNDGLGAGPLTVKDADSIKLTKKIYEDILMS